MRRQYFYWTYLVLSIVLTVYGGYSIIYSVNRKEDIPILGLVFFILGIVLFIIYFVLYIITYIQKKNKPVEKEVVEVKQDKPQVEIKEETKVETKQEVKPTVTKEYKSIPRKDTPRKVNYEHSAYRSFDGGSGYVKLVGYGPVLRINNEQIVDMRTNTYYRIEGNMVNMMGSGPVFEISRNRIRSAFGSYLYEISGSNINKTFGGYYASISGGVIQTYDLKERYELTDSFNMAQQLAIVAILFGAY